MEYEFRFVVEGVSVDDIDVVETLDRELDAMLFRGGGVDLLDIAAEGVDALAAAMKAARGATMSIPGLRVLRLYRDLVGVPEIAERVGVSRQNVHQWIAGKRHGGVSPFPRSEGTAGRAQVWLWTEVNEWLEQIVRGDGVNRPTRNEMADIDSALNCSLQHRTERSMERWRRNRQVGVALYEADLVLSGVDDNGSFMDSPMKGWDRAEASHYKVAMQ
ncbi:helix-turn-helix domain-containing protein [Streptosporangium sp. NPDC006007]|uniref:helix-turn-helix transcriptional regulator n=1 Tax=Streptosporangium sp. NPDC006007 TaxID=3154575 RepID=UPI0033B6BD19